MRSRFAKLVVLMLIAILPVRALASVMTSLCIAGHQQAEAQMQAPEHGNHHGAIQHHEDGSTGGSGHGCGYCAKHCTGASIVIPSEPPRISVATFVDVIPFRERFAPGFVPGRLDRPPLSR